MVNIFRKMADKWKELSEEARDRREFQKLVADQTKPIRRGAYLKEKMKQAVEEGFLLAQQEKLKKEQRKSLKDFGINEKEIQEIKPVSIRKVNEEDIGGSITKSQANILKPTIDWGWDKPSKYLESDKLKNKEKKNGK